MYRMLLITLLSTLLTACYWTTTPESLDMAGTVSPGYEPVATTAPLIDYDSLVVTWNHAIATHDLAAMRPLYADTVSYYGKRLSKSEVLARKAAFYDRNPGYTQYIDEVTESTLAGNKVEIYFTKEMRYAADKETRLSAYLVFEKRDDTWKIIEESDRVTDGTLTRKGLADKPEAGAVKGDFDGDYRRDWLWVKAPYDCDPDTRNCDIKLYSSSGRLDGIPLMTTNENGGSDALDIVHVGDLDGDGTDDMAFVAAGGSSAWRGGFVYTFPRGNKPRLVAEFSVWTGSQHEGPRILKTGPQSFTIMEDMMRDEEFVVGKRVVELN